MCRAGGAIDDLFIIQFLPIYLAKSARAWLDHLSRNAINHWHDLWEVFTGNFQGTYVCPGNPWDLRRYPQKLGEPLWDYIRHFSQNCHALPSVVDANVVLAFWDGTTCRTVVHEFRQPETIKELLEIATRHVSGEEVIGAAFSLVEAVAPGKKLKALTRSLWCRSNVISSDALGCPRTISRKLLKQLVLTTRIPSSTNSVTAP
jgi:hypothetical protein